MSDQTDNNIDIANGIERIKKLGKKTGRVLTKALKRRILEWVSKGLRDYDIFTALKISKQTYYNYMTDDPDFADEVREVRYKIDEPVVSALRRNALGFKYEERQYIVEKDDLTGEEVRVLKKVVEKAALPETEACKTWLYNRYPDEWKAKQAIDVTTDGKSIIPPVDYSNITEEEAKKLYLKMVSQQQIQENKE